MERDNTTGNTQGTDVPAGRLASSARRRLLRGGLGAAPVVLTLASRPVLATQVCVTGSSFASANASRPNSGVYACSGRNHAYWTSPTTSWPCAKTTPFSGVGGVFTPSIFASGATFWQVLTGGCALSGSPTPDQVALAKNCVVAWLNVASSAIGPEVLTPDTIKAVWSQGRNGTFLADSTTGVTLSITQVNSWLAQMWA